MLSELTRAQLATQACRGEMTDATHYGVNGSPGGGPYVQIWLKISDGVIERASYETHGCPSSAASAGMLCTLARGREVERMMSFTDKDLLTVLGGLPEGKEHFATMAVSAMIAAVKGGNND